MIDKQKAKKGEQKLRLCGAQMDEICGIRKKSSLKENHDPEWRACIGADGKFYMMLAVGAKRSSNGRYYNIEGMCNLICYLERETFTYMPYWKIPPVGMLLFQAADIKEARQKIKALGKKKEFRTAISLLTDHTITISSVSPIATGKNRKKKKSGPKPP